MPKNELDGLPVIDADATEQFSVQVRGRTCRRVIRKTPNATR